MAGRKWRVTVTTIGGGYIGDGGRTTAASLNEFLGDASHITFDAERNHRVRKVSTAGTITTIAGTGSLGHYPNHGGERQRKQA